MEEVEEDEDEDEGVVVMEPGTSGLEAGAPWRGDRSLELGEAGEGEREEWRSLSDSSPPSPGRWSGPTIGMRPIR